MSERIYQLIQFAEEFASTDDRKVAITRAKKEAKQNGFDVLIAERRVTMRVTPTGRVIGGDE
jgi:hypothetical protein